MNNNVSECSLAKSAFPETISGAKGKTSCFECFICTIGFLKNLESNESDVTFIPVRERRGASHLWGNARISASAFARICVCCSRFCV